MGFIPLILIAIAVYWFWIRPKMAEDKLPDSAQDSLLKYGIKGINFRNFAHKLRSGTFMGYITNEPENPHDKNAIAIYNSAGLHLGYIPEWKTEELKELFGNQLNESVTIFGIVSYNRDSKHWWGVIYVPNNIDVATQTRLYKKFTNNPSSFDYIEWA